MAMPSPCIGTCRIDEDSGLCMGCVRTRREIKDWRDASEDVLSQIWAQLPARRARLGLGIHRLGWGPDRARSFVEGTMRANAGTWVFGAFGAVAEFCIGPGEDVEVSRHEGRIAARTARGAIRFDLPDDVRVLSSSAGETSETGIIILAVPRRHPGPTAHAGLVGLGPDGHAIHPEGLGQWLFDLGLDRSGLRFCIRTADEGLAGDLEALSGEPWAGLLAKLGPRILHDSPDRVVTTPVGRVEVFAPIPPPGGRSPEGPHTHLLPTHLASGRETPPGIDVPEALLPCAIFYPGPEDGPGTCETI